MWCWFSVSVNDMDSKEHLDAPEGLTWEETWSWLGDMLHPKPYKNGVVRIGIGWIDQCNLEFDSREIHALSDSDVALAISCYEVDDWPEDNLPAKSR